MLRKKSKKIKQSLTELNFKKRFYQNELRRIEEIEEGIEGSLWKYIERKTRGAIDQIDNELFNFEKVEDKDIRTFLARKKELINMLSVKDYVLSKEKVENKLQEISNAIKLMEGQK